MKPLNTRFGDSQVLKVNDVSECLDINFSKVARAALKLGLMQITTLAAADKEKAIDLVLINDARAK
jgi:predicted adenine nucleotide alpha hydrolase (AANH) superfamily ATPase